MRSDTRFWGVAALFGALILLVTGIVLEPDSIGAPAGAAYIAAAGVALLGVVGIWMGR